MASYLAKAYRRIRFGEPIVVISGLPRSGTSMTMQMLEAGGMSIVTDGVRTPGEDNPKGYYEDERVKELHKEKDKSWLREARGKAIKIISFLLKDLPDTNNYKVLFMHRSLDEVLASQQKMLERTGETSETGDERMLELFENHLWKVNYLLRHRSDFEVMDLKYKEIIESPLAQAERIREFLGNRLDVEQMAGAVDAQLYRNRR